MKLSRLLLTAALGGPAITAVLAQGTAFTYQGRLDDGGTPATGLYDLSFTVYNAATGGASAGTRNVDNVGVTNGLFTVTLDFGAGVFAGAPEWLEIAVRPGASTGAYTGLAPRQAITPTPYALYAGGASATGLTGTLPSAALGGTYAGAVNFSNKGNTFAGNAAGLTNLPAANLAGTVADARLSANVPLLNAANRFTGPTNTFSGPVGIGTATPAAKLDVNGNIVSSGGITVNAAGSGSVNISDLTGDAGKSWFLYNGYYGNGNFAIARYDPALGGFPADRNLFINPAGNVGVGTTSPGAKLDVNGTARFSGGVQVGAGVAYGLYGDTGNIGLHSANGGGIFLTGASGGGRTMVWNPTQGLLGVGTATPGVTLDLLGAGGPGASIASVVLRARSTAAYGAMISVDAGNLAGGNEWQLFSTGGSANEGQGKFIIRKGGSATEPLAITPDGNVGLGTVTPSAKLEVVNGADGANAIAVTQTGHGASAIYASNTSGDGYAGYFNGAVGVSSEITCTAVNLTSDRNAKEKFKAVNPREVLAKVVDLPITEWQYKSAGDARHLGPMAQDFHAAFALGHDDKHITSIDEDGVALAAIQGLNAKLEEQLRDKDTRITELERSLDALKGLVNRLANQSREDGR